MALPTPDDVYIMLDAKDKRGQLVKIVRVARDYQRDEYNDFIRDVPITSNVVKECNPEPNISFKLRYTNKKDALHYPPNSENVVLVDFIRELDGPISIMSTDQIFLEYYKNFLNKRLRRNEVYIIIDAKDIREQLVKSVYPARDYQRNAYKKFTNTIDITNTTTTVTYDVPGGGTFQLKYNDRMHTYDDYKENGYVLVDFIRDTGTTTYMSANEGLLKSFAGWMNRMSDGFGGGGRKSTRRHRKLTRRHRKSTRHHRKSTRRRRRKY